MYYSNLFQVRGRLVLVPYIPISVKDSLFYLFKEIDGTFKFP